MTIGNILRFVFNLSKNTYILNAIKRLSENVIKGGGKIKTTSPCVFIIKGILRIPCQVIVTNQLPHGMYNGFQLLTQKASKEQVIAYLNENLQKDPDTIWPNMRAVLSICFHVNPNL